MMPHAVVAAALSQISAIVRDRDSKCCPLFLVFQVDILESVYPSKFRMHCLSPPFKPRAHFGVS